MFIYVITNDVNEKAYVGLHSGRDLRTRWITHLSFARKGSRSLISRAIRKHGEGKFHITSIWSGHVSVNNLKALERYFIRSLRTKVPAGYNLTDGGDGTPGYRHSEEEKMRRSERMREQIASGNICNQGKKRPREVVAKIVAANKGQKRAPWTAEMRGKLSLVRMGNKNSLGVHPSPETTAKRLLTRGDWKPNAEHHRRLVEGAIRHNTGKKASEETKRKMSLSQKARWVERKNADAATNRGTS